MTETRFKYIDETETAGFPDQTKIQMETVHQLRRIANAFEKANGDW